MCKEIDYAYGQKAIAATKTPVDVGSSPSGFSLVLAWFRSYFDLAKERKHRCHFWEHPFETSRQ
jgi:hypothetical protein